MATPFETWFSSDWQTALRNVPADSEALTNGQISRASWDRRAAYLLWVERGRPNATWVERMRPLYDRNGLTPVVSDATVDDLLAGPPAEINLEDLLS